MTRAVVVFSAGQEWAAAKEFYAPAGLERTPYGECFFQRQDAWDLTLIHGGWGKVPAAASAEYALTRWQPDLLVNLGTCGGFAGTITAGEVVLADRTLVYDIVEQMGDPAAAIEHFSTRLDLTWLREPYPQAVRRGTLVSADRDIVAEDIPRLAAYGAPAGDWESGAIAWVCARRGTHCLILRGVSDLVGVEGGEAYGNAGLFAERARGVTQGLLEHLPLWLKCVG